MRYYIETPDEPAPDGYHYATMGEYANADATHCVCTCHKRRVADREQADHVCGWIWLVKDEVTE